MDGGKRKLLKISVLLLSMGLLIEAAGYSMAQRALWEQEARSTEINPALLSLLRLENSSLREKIRTFLPQGRYIVVDTAENLLYLKDGPRILLKATISAGSGSILIEPSGERKWIFETPRGEFTIQSKIVKPTWLKPDWAFIEEGKPIPKNMRDRVEAGMLGDYALGFGDGYFIHGTLYTRLLGKNITHGCIRVGDQDLKTLFQSVPLGTKVFIL
jgi:lipoprotein-anchoring transpeptidase ErfK/SrfK